MTPLSPRAGWCTRIRLILIWQTLGRPCLSSCLQNKGEKRSYFHGGPLRTSCFRVFLCLRMLWPNGPWTSFLLLLGVSLGPGPHNFGSEGSPTTVGPQFTKLVSLKKDIFHKLINIWKAIWRWVKPLIIWICRSRFAKVLDFSMVSFKSLISGGCKACYPPDGRSLLALKDLFWLLPRKTTCLLASTQTHLGASLVVWGDVST